VVVEHNGHTIHSAFRDSAPAGPPIIFLHGITASVDFWPAVLEDEFSDRPCLAVSLPGHAPSTVPADFGVADVTPELFADCVAAAVENVFPEESVHLVGWSTGGFAALRTAARNPARVRSVTSISGFVHGRWGSLLGVMQGMARRTWTQPVFRWNLAQLARHRWLFKSVLRRFCAGPMSDARAAGKGVDSMYGAAAAHDALTLQRLFAAIHDFDESACLAQIHAPVCVIGGDSDPVIRKQETLFLAEHLPNADLQLLTDMGHLFFAERRVEVLELIRKMSQC